MLITFSLQLKTTWKQNQSEKLYHLTADVD